MCAFYNRSFIRNIEVLKKKAGIGEDEIKKIKETVADADWHMKWGEAIKKGNACMLVCWL